MDIRVAFRLAALFILFSPLASADDCGKDGANSPALDKYRACLNKMSVKVKQGIVVDADTNTAMVIDTDAGNGTPSECYKIKIGKNSAGGTGSAQCGNQPNSGQTPSGMLLTYNKTESGVFSSPNSYCGLQGTNSSNDKTKDRGVLLHPCNGEEQTAGCICFVDDWTKIKSLVKAQGDNGTPVFVYAKTMQGDGCPNGGAGSSSGSGNYGNPASDGQN